MKLNVPENIKTLIPYPPGKPLEELEREYGITGSIKLASNENALGPSPKATAAIANALKNLHRYPVVIIWLKNWLKKSGSMPGKLFLVMAPMKLSSFLSPPFSNRTSRS